MVFLRGNRGGVVVICVANCDGQFWVRDGTGFWGLFWELHTSLPWSGGGLKPSAIFRV